MLRPRKSAARSSQPRSKMPIATCGRPNWHWPRRLALVDAGSGEGSCHIVGASASLWVFGNRGDLGRGQALEGNNRFDGARADLTWRSGATTTLIYTLPQVRLPDDLPSILNNKARLDKESFNLRLWGGLFIQPQMIGNTALDVSYVRLQERDAQGSP